MATGEKEMKKIVEVTLYGFNPETKSHKI